MDELELVVVVDELELLVLVEDEVLEVLSVVDVEVIVLVLELVWVEVEFPVWAAMGVGERTIADPKTRMAITSRNIQGYLFMNVHRSQC